MVPMDRAMTAVTGDATRAARYDPSVSTDTEPPALDTDQLRPHDPPPAALVTDGGYLFGTYDGPIATINPLDVVTTPGAKGRLQRAAGPLFLALPWIVDGEDEFAAAWDAALGHERGDDGATAPALFALHDELLTGLNEHAHAVPKGRWVAWFVSGVTRSCRLQSLDLLSQEL